MKSLYYLSAASYVQVDLPILAQLSNSYRINYGLIVPMDRTYLELTVIQRYCVENNIRLKLFSFRRRQRDIRIALEFLLVLKDIRRIKTEIVYTISHDIPVLSLLCLFLDNRKTIVALHDVAFHSGSKFSFMLKISRKIVTTYFKFFHVFSGSQERLFRSKYPGKKVYTIPLSLGYYGESEPRSDLIRTPSEEVRFLFFGNIAPYKGLKTLLNAVNNLSLKYSHFKLIIAGQCADWEKEYASLVNNNPVIDKMIHLIDSKSARKLFLDAHYLILPYKDATQSGPLMMAYHYNLPVIASKIEPFKDMVLEGTCGYLYDTSDPKGLEKVLEESLTRDWSEYEILTQRLRRYVESKFSIIHLRNMYEEMFSDIA